MEAPIHGGGGGGSISITGDRPPSQIETKMNDLNNTVDRLQLQIDQLITKVDPILQPLFTENDEKSSIPRDAAKQSRLAESIEDVSMRIRRITQLVELTLDRVEV